MDSETLFLLAKSQVGTVTVLSIPGAPTTGTWVTGNVALDSNDVLWVCIVGGTPGTWSEAVSSTSIPLSIVTTEGDLIVGTGPGAVTRLGVGSSSQVLTGGTTPTWTTLPAFTTSETILSAALAISANTPTTVLSFSPGVGNFLLIASIAMGGAASSVYVDAWLGTVGASTSGLLGLITTTVGSPSNTKTVVAFGTFTSGENVFLNVEGSGAFNIEIDGQAATNVSGITKIVAIGLT